MIKSGIYQHYKGKYYQVIGMARHSESLEEMVVYQALYDNYGLWVRPIKMWNEIISFNGQSMPRFKFISESMSVAPKVD
jgi:hypothetical protein